MIVALISAIAGVPMAIAIDAMVERLALRPRDDADEEQGVDDDARADSSARHVWRRGRAQEYLLSGGATWRRVLIVAVSAVLGFFLGWQYGAGWELMLAGAYMAALVVVAGTDLLDARIPNVVTYPSVVLALVVGMLLPDADRIDVLGGGALSGGVFLLMALLPGGGLGDAKLGLFTGLALGLELVVPAIVVTAITGSIVSVLILVATRMRALHQPIPYGPYIALGAVVVMLSGGTAFEHV
jgi:leader peptidase (prepilin peptidase) / N-methyltransferase